MTLPSTTPAVLCLTLEGWDLAKDASNAKRRQHWSEQARRVKLARSYVFAAIHKSGQGGIRFKVPVVVQFTRLMGARAKLLDRDNRRAAVKPLLDALVRERVFVDDSDKYLADYEVTQEKSLDGKPAVRIEVRAAKEIEHAG